MAIYSYPPDSGTGIDSLVPALRRIDMNTGHQWLVFNFTSEIAFGIDENFIPDRDEQDFKIEVIRWRRNMLSSVYFQSG